jgi:hypothetical protein
MDSIMKNVTIIVKGEINAGDNADWRMKVRELRNEIRKLVISKNIKITHVDSKEEK